MIYYLNGDATEPRGGGLKILPHIVNSKGGWGAGYVLALSKKWPEPEIEYRRWSLTDTDASGGKFELGNVQFVPVSAEITVANMLAQEGYFDGKNPPVRYWALEQCMAKVAEHARHLRASLHMPRIGTGLGGGSWEKVEPIIRAATDTRGLNVCVYDWSKSKK